MFRKFAVRSADPTDRRPPSFGWRSGLLAVLLPLLAGMSATPASAQETGRVLGQVVEAGTEAPLRQVQVYLPETGLGTISRQNGQFVILNVPPGTYELRAERVGMGTITQEVTVAAGQAVQVTLQMETEALALDELVVTGTAGAARQREVGNSVERLNFEQVDQPVVSLEGALQGRAPGVNLMTTSGVIGAGSQIRLRGNVSVSMSNQPLIYVDGVRIYNEAYPSQHGRDFPGGRGAGTASSPLNDINPQDIERIEVVKGPAATTLYGTEASAGVIQIFTRHGEEGAARWTAQANQGFGWIQPFAPEGGTYGAENRRSEFLYIDPWLSNGHWQGYDVSVSGGRGDLGYFLSGSMEDNKGILPDDRQERYSLRGNLDFSPLPSLTLQWNTAYTNHWTQRTSMGNNAHGLGINAYRLDQNYFGDASKELLDQVLEYDNFEEVGRFTSGLTARHTVGDLSNRLNIGYDLANWEGRNVRQFGYILYDRGAVGVTRWSNETLTFDYVGSYAFQLPGDLRSTFSWGAQSTSTNETEVEGWAEGFPGPGEPTLNSGAETQSFEERMRVVNAGGFVQNVFDFGDRYFLTLGLRVDGNSAFGESFGLQPYPKASASYVVSDEPFWPEALGSFRLRAAYGHAGRAPGAFDAVRTWDPASWAGESAFVPRNLGNPELGPERTKETEVGFEAAVLDDRLSVDFTFYNQRTEDALFPVVNVPSDGDWPGQLSNVGTIRNRGVELALDATVYETRSYGWDLGASVSTNHSKVLDLGGAPAFETDGDNWIIEGYPAPAIRTNERIMNPHEIAEPVISTELEDQVWGPAWPTTTLQMSSTIRLPYSIRLSARGEYQGGHYVQIGPTSSAVGRGNQQWPICFEANRLWEQGRDDEVKAWDRLRCDQEMSSGDWNISPADFFKMRDISLTLPAAFAVPGADDASLTLSVQNVRLWKHRDMELFDPEMGGWNTGAQGGSRVIAEHIPPPAMFNAQLRVSF